MFHHKLPATLLATLLAAGATAAEVSVKAIKVVETREMDLNPTKEKDNAFFGGFDQNRLAVTIELTGDILANASRYGHINITAAQTDTGEKLEVIPFPSAGHHPTDRYESIDREFMYAFEQTKPTDRIKFDLGFKPCKRSAGSIKSIHGTLQVLTVDRMEDITFDNVAKRKGESLQHPILKAAGINAQVTRIEGSVNALESVTIELHDTEDVIQEVYLTDARNEKLNVSAMRMFMGSKTMLTLQGWEKLPSDAKLVMTAGVGQKKVPVNFKLNDLALP